MEKRDRCPLSVYSKPGGVLLRILGEGVPPTTPTVLCEYVNKVNHILFPGSLQISIV